MSNMSKKLQIALMLFISMATIALATITGVYALSSLNFGTTGGIKFGQDTYPLVLELNGGQAKGTTLTSYTYSDDVDFVLPDGNEYATKTGYTFDSWCSDEALTTKVTSIPAKTRGSKTFYAKWIENASYLNRNWKTILGITNSDVSKITFTSDESLIPEGVDSTQVGTISSTSITTWTQNASCFGVDAYLSTVNDKTEIVFYSPYTIYAPKISEYLFSDNSTNKIYFTSLSDIVFSNFDIKYVTHMAYMFLNCSNLTSLNLANFNTSNVISCYGLFSGCSSLISVTFGENWNLSKVASLYGTFRDCSSLRSLDLSTWKTSTSLTALNSMFFKCTNLESIDFGDNFVTSSVKSFSQMFDFCNSLTTFDGIEKFDTSSATGTGSNSFYYMFRYCYGMTELDLSNWTVDNVQTTIAMFYDCSNLTTLNLSGWKLHQNTNASQMLFNCNSLAIIKTPSQINSRVIDLPSGKNYYNQKTYAGPYTEISTTQNNLNCTLVLGESLTFNVSTSIDGTTSKVGIYHLNNSVQNLTIENPTKADYTFSGWTVSWADSMHADNSLLPTISGTSTTLSIPANCYGNITLTANWRENVSYFNRDWKTILGITNSDVSKIAFTSDDSLIPEGVDSIQVGIISPTSTTIWTQDASCFGVDAYLSTINDKTEILFYSPYTIYAPKNSDALFGYSNANATADDVNVFSSLTEIIFDNFDVSYTTSTRGMFYNCTALQTLNLSTFNTINVTTMQSMFRNCRSLSSINFGATFNTSKVTTMTEMFYNCNSLLELDLSCFDTSQVKSFAWMFLCTKIKKITFADNINTSKVTNMQSMFANCSSLTTITNFDKFSFASAVNINSMFIGCKSLTSIEFNDEPITSVVNLYNMFANCVSLTEIDVSMFNINNATTIYGWFQSCNNLTNVILPKNVVNNKAISLYGIFKSCYKLTTIDLSSWTFSNVTSINEMFSNCLKLQEIDLSGLSLPNVTDTASIFYSCNQLKTIHTPQTISDNCSLQLPSDKNYYNQKTYAGPYTQISTNQNNLKCTLVLGENLTFDVSTSIDGTTAEVGTYYLNNSVQSLTIQNPTKTGYTFAGWTVSWTDDVHADNSLLPTISGTSTTLFIPANCYGNVTLTAKWQQAEAKIGNVYYKTLEEAIESAISGQVIEVIINEIILESSVYITDKSITMKNTDITTTIKRNVTTADFFMFIISKDSELIIEGFNSTNLLILDGQNGAGDYSLISNSGVLTIKGNTKFINNDNSKGTNASNPYIRGSVVINVENSGAKLYVEGGIYQNNTSRYGGVFLFNSGTSGYIKNAQFTENSSTRYGGAIYAYGANITEISNSIFSNNSSTDYGGVFYLQNINSVTLANNTFNNNSATVGGVIYLNNENMIDIDFVSGTFTTNTASSKGGDIAIYGQTKLNVNGNIALNSIYCDSLDTANYYINVNTADVNISKIEFNTNKMTTVNGKLVGFDDNIYSETLANKIKANVQNIPNGYEIKNNGTSGSKGIFIATIIYDIDFNLNSGSWVDLYIAPSTYTVKDAITLPTSSNIERAGYTFAGWYDNASFSGSQITSITAGSTGNKTFYAKWIANTQTITYYSTSSTAYTTQNVNYDETYKMPTTPTKSGYTFVGWTATSTSNSAEWTSETQTCKGNKSWYAVWQRVYTLTYAYINSSGARATTSSSQTIKYPYNTTTTTYEFEIARVSNKTFTSDSVQYTFIGFSDNQSTYQGTYANTSDLSGKTTGITVSTSKTLYAVYSAELKITYNANGGSGAPSQSSGYAYKNAGASAIKSQAATITISSTTPTKTGYTFIGWADTNSASSTQYNAGTSYQFSASKTIYAVWRQNASYLYTFWKYKINNLSSITSIQFKQEAIDTSDIQIGATNSTGSTLWTTATTSCHGVGAYVSGTTLIIRSPYTIYAPQNSSMLFSSGERSGWQTKLTNITFDNFDTSQVINMSYMFAYYSSLTSLNLSSFDTSKVTNMSDMIRYCSSLTSLNLSSFDTSKVTNMTHMFADCSSLTSLNLSNFNTSKVTDMTGMFYECTKLKTLDVTGFNTSQVTNMASMFEGCARLNTIQFGSSFKTSQVTNMTYMFADCSSLTSLDLSSFDTSQVTNMSSMFNNCTSLTSLDLSSFDMSKVTYTTNMLTGCTALESITTPIAVKTVIALPTGGTWIREDNGTTPTTIPVCSEGSGEYTLKRGAILNANWQSQISNLSSVTKIVFEKSSTTGSINVGASSLTNSSTFVNTITASVDNGTLYIRSPYTIYAPQNSANLFANLDAPQIIFDNFDTTNVTVMFRMFFESTSLISLDLRSFDTSKVTDMSEMFFGCESLTSLYLTSFDTSNVKNMTSMFKYCKLLKFLDLSSFVINITFSDYDFGTDSMLDRLDALEEIKTPKILKTSIVLPAIQGVWYNEENSDVYDNIPVCINESEGSYTILRGAVLSKSASFTSNLIRHIYFQQSDTKGNISMGADSINGSGQNDTVTGTIKLSVDRVRSLYVYSKYKIFAPENSAMLFFSAYASKIFFDNFDTRFVTNMAGMFLECSNLTDLDLSSFDTSKVTNMAGMFESCESLNTIQYGSSFKTSQVIDMSNLYYMCLNLTNLDLSSFDTSKVTDMTNMFAGSSLISLNISNFTISSSCNVNNMIETCSSLITIYVPKTIASNVSITLPEGNWTSGSTTYSAITSACAGKTLTKQTNYVASINGNNYETLESAINSANDGDTIILLKDITNVREQYTINKSITITSYSDVTVNASIAPFFTINSGTLTIKTTGENILSFINDDGTVFVVNQNGNLTISGSPTIESNSDYAINLNYGKNLKISGSPTINGNIFVQVYDGELSNAVVLGGDFNGTARFVFKGDLNDDGYIFKGTYSTGNMGVAGYDYLESARPDSGYVLKPHDGYGYKFNPEGCFTSDTYVTVWDEKKKKLRRKKAKKLTYKDKLLVWNFDKGCFEFANALWIQKEKVANKYTLITFSDGSKLKVVEDHAVFNYDKQFFCPICSNESWGCPIGTRVVKEDGSIVTIVSKKVVNKKVYFTNIFSKYHMNIYTSGILTSTAFNNMYKIENMKYVKDVEKKCYNLTLLDGISDDWIDGMRLKEFPDEILIAGIKHFANCKTFKDYIDMKISEQKFD